MGVGDIYVPARVVGMKRLIKQVELLREEMRAAMATNQEQLDALTAAVTTGIQELSDEIARLAALPPEAIDFTNLQAIADRLAGDAFPSPPAGAGEPA